MKRILKISIWADKGGELVFMGFYSPRVPDREYYENQLRHIKRFWKKR